MTDFFFSLKSTYETKCANISQICTSSFKENKLPPSVSSVCYIVQSLRQSWVKFYIFKTYFNIVCVYVKTFCLTHFLMSVLKGKTSPRNTENRFILKYLAILMLVCWLFPWEVSGYAPLTLQRDFVIARMVTMGEKSVKYKCRQQRALNMTHSSVLAVLICFYYLFVFLVPGHAESGCRWQRTSLRSVPGLPRPDRR